MVGRSVGDENVSQTVKLMRLLKGLLYEILINDLAVSSNPRAVPKHSVLKLNSNTLKGELYLLKVFLGGFGGLIQVMISLEKK